MEITVFSWPSYIPGEVRLVKGLLARGVKTFHLRKPSWGRQATDNFLAELTPNEQRSVMLHQYPDLRQSYPVKGIHFSSRLPLANQQALLRERGWAFSTSVHNLDQISKLPSGFRMVYISPVFDSISKTNHFANFEWSELKAFLRKQKSPPPLYALGGIEAENLPYVKDLGFQGAAVLGALWKPFQEKGYEAALNCYKTIFKASKIRDYGQ